VATLHLDRESITRLRDIDRRGLAPGDCVLPDFMIVGPQKTRTTRLYDNLEVPPGVLFARVKEPSFVAILNRCFYRSACMLQCADFTRNFTRWKKQLEPGHFLALVFERCSDAPLQYIAETHSLLGLRSAPDCVDSARLHARSNAAKLDPAVSPEHRAFLTTLHAAEIVRLNETNGENYAL
jgi:hypothetical protein